MRFLTEKKTILKPKRNVCAINLSYLLLKEISLNAFKTVNIQQRAEEKIISSSEPAKQCFRRASCRK